MTTSSPGCRRGRRLRHGPPLGWRCPGGRLPAAARCATPWPGCGGCDGDARLGILRNDGGAGRRRQRLRLHRAGRRHALPRRRTIGRRQQAAPRQFRHFLVVVGSCCCGCCCCRAEWPRAGAAPDRKRYCRSARAPVAQARSSWRPRGPQYRSGQWFETSRGFKRRIGLATLYRLIRRSQAHRLTRRIRRGKGGLPPCPAATGQPRHK